MEVNPSASSGFDFKRLFRSVCVALLLVVACAAPLRHLLIIDRVMPSSHSDLVDDWMGVRDALQGKDPYSAEVTRDIQIVYYGRPLTAADKVPDQAFPYPATLVIPFAPLAPLSWPTVRLTYLWVIVPLLFLSFGLCARLVDPNQPALKIGLAVFFACCSWPVMWALRLQQPTLMVAVVVFSGCFFLSRQRPWLAGILLALSTVKPQLVLPLLAWLLLWACIRRIWSFVASFSLSMTVLLLWTERLVPGWFPHWIEALHRYSHRYGQTQGQLPLQNAFGHGLGLVATALLVAYGGFVLWRLRNSPARSPEFRLAVALTLAIALCGTPTMLPVIYNQTLLLPGCLILFGARSEAYYPDLVRRVAFACVVWGYVAIYISALCESIFKPSALWDALPFQNMLLPAIVTLSLALMGYAESSGKSSSTPGSDRVTAPANEQQEAVTLCCQTT